MLNFKIGEKEAKVLLTYLMDDKQRRLFDGIGAPAFTKKAIKMMRRKKDKCRLIVNPALARLGRDSLDTLKRFRYVRGGFLIQSNYTFVLDFSHPKMKIYGRLEKKKRKTYYRPGQFR